MTSSSEEDLSGMTLNAPPVPFELSTINTELYTVPSLATGQKVEDYEIIRLLGKGGFANVYLARQISLPRLVALKVSQNMGTEARTLAQLQHNHIVHVFAEIVSIERNLRLLALQYVPGTTLAILMSNWEDLPFRSRNGSRFIDTLDSLCQEKTDFDPGSTQVRSFLSNTTPAELVCWIGSRLAEALAHSHNLQIEHRDIKPANILINQYGKPFLTDFNIAQDSKTPVGSIGGTVHYMSPEQLDVFRTKETYHQTRIDHRSDIYSLGLVLYELMTGKHPFPSSGGNLEEIVLESVSSRQKTTPSARSVDSGIPEILDRVLRQCLESNPEQRYASAGALMSSLNGCMELLETNSISRPGNRMMEFYQARPYTALLLSCLIPHMAASVINIAYNYQNIVRQTADQQAAFVRLVFFYNMFMYPVLIVMAFLIFRNSYVKWKRLLSYDDNSRESAAKGRKELLSIPKLIILLSCLGWFPGAVFFPVMLDRLAGPVTFWDSAHFVFSFLISGVIATTYAYLATEFIVISVLYPRWWTDPTDSGKIMQSELERIPSRLKRFQFYAVLIPLAGAALLVGTGPERLTVVFRILISLLIGLGVAGFVLATYFCNQLFHYFKQVKTINPNAKTG